MNDCCFRLGLLLGMAISTVSPVFSAENTAKPGTHIPLFQDGTLSHWVIEHGAEVDFVDGHLRFKGGNGWLRSPHQYRDIALHVEWKALQKSGYDAGIYLRAGAEGTPFPKPAHQVNLLEGHEGNIGNIPGAKSTGLVKQGEWNTFDLVVKGDRVALSINGRPAYDVAGVAQPQGYLGFQIEVPKGGQFLLRNVVLTELDFEPLFNGVDLTGWSGAEGPAEVCWNVSDGLLVCSGQKGPWLRSAKEYGDFSFRVEYWLSTGGNSGVFVRVPEDGNHHRKDDTLPEAGFEVQMLDDSAPAHAQLKDYQYSASVYDIAGAHPRNTHPPGEWNTLEIICQGQHIQTIHNGRKVVDLNGETHPLINLRKTSGYLGLQNHSTVVKFRNVRIGPPLQ